MAHLDSEMAVRLCRVLKCQKECQLAERIEKLLTIKAVCEELNVSKHTVYRWLHSIDPEEHLAGFVLPGGRSYRMRRVDLDAFLERHKIKPGDAWEDDGQEESDE